MIGFLVGMALFLGVHLTRVVAPDWRLGKVAASEGFYKGIYSLLSLGGFVMLIWFYGDAVSVSPLFYEPPVWMKHINALLMLFAALIFGLYLVPAGTLKARVKHPMLLAVKIWALGHLLANGTLAALILFGGFLAWAVIVRISIKRRERAGLAQPVVAGPAKWDAIGLAAGLALYAIFMGGLHIWLFGVSPLPLS
jgi:uncharacterized membrane protein